MNNLTGTYEYIDYYGMLAGCKMKLGIRDSTIDDIYLKDLLNEGLKELKLKTGTNVQIIAQLPIDPITKSTKLPPGFIEFTQRVPIVYTNAEGFAINGITSQIVTSDILEDDGSLLSTTSVPFAVPYGGFVGPVFTNNTFFKDSPYGSMFSTSGTVTLVDGYLWFSSNVDAPYIKFSYWGANIDLSTGDIKIPAYCGRTLELYACFNYCRTNADKYGNMFQSYQQEWKNGKLECRARANKPDSNTMAFINNIMKSLI